MSKALVPVVLLLASCALSSKGSGGFIDNGGAGGGGTGGSGGSGVCSSAAQCPPGYTCSAGTCVPPEQELDRGLDAPPVATPRYVFALNPTAASVARIDPLTLAIEAVSVGPGPVALAPLPGEDAALVLSYDDASLSLVDSSTSPSKVTRHALTRQYARLTLSADAAWAVVWPDPLAAPPSGAEGIFALVNVAKLRAGAAAAEAVFERPGGYRITDVLFRVEAGRANRVFVFAKSSVSTYALTEPPPTLPVRLALPASMSQDVSSREVVSSPDARVVMVRATGAPELAAFDGAALTVVPLSEVATDLDLLADGSAAVAALRTKGALAYIELPADVQNPSGITELPVTGGGVGQVALPRTGAFALVYSNVTGGESFARVDLPSGAVTRYEVEKWVDEIALSPDSASALVLHRPNPMTMATDPYEAQVDRDQGFSVFDLSTGFWQLQRTGTTRPSRFAFSPRGGFVGVALRDDALRRYALQAVNLSSLVSNTLPLASVPLFMGTVPEAPGITPHRVFVSQAHPGGRISVIQLDTGQVRTATGFTLNAEIQ